MADVVNLNANAQGGMRATTSVMLAFAVISFCLRACSTYTDQVRKLGLDDLCVGCALVCVQFDVSKEK